MTVRTRLFGQTVRQLARAAPLFVGAQDPCGAVVAAMAAVPGSCALVTDEGGRLTGILTERDILRRVVFQVSSETPIAAVMSHPVESIREDEFPFRAISRMRQLGIRHLPVVDGAGRPKGLLDVQDLLSATAPHLMDLIDTLPAGGCLAGLREVKLAQVALAEELFEDRVPAAQIQQLLTDINTDLFHRIIATALETMQQEGKGPPPVVFEALVMGSGGRGENFLMPDQDNGFILDDYPEEQHDQINDYFIDLAERATHGLQEIGFPLCLGHVMATNPLWRKSREQWRRQIEGWSRKRHLAAARLVGIFLDFRPTYGAGIFAEELREHLLRVIGESRGFLRNLFEQDAHYGTALGWFSRLVTDRENPAHRGALNLKLNGIRPLVDTVRFLALLHGVKETATLARLDRLEELEVIDRNEREYLDHAFEQVTRLLLLQQIADFKADNPVSSYLTPSRLSRRDYDQLVESFKTIERLRSRVRSEFLGDALVWG